ncbi:hypothetical protein ACWIG4_30275 [Streptomyces sp. NPDC002248]
MTLDDRLRTRLAEIRAAAGVPHAQVSLEVLYFLPKEFLDAYATLFSRALKSDGGESARGQMASEQGELGKSPKTAVRGGGKRRFKKSFTVLDEGALDLKGRMDKRLRMLGREIVREIDAAELSRRGVRNTEGEKGAKRVAQCEGCRSFVAVGWRFCSWCGKAVSEERDHPIRG